jgi:putative salt-induced outer membrane protein YdiY
MGQTACKIYFILIFACFFSAISGGLAISDELILDNNDRLTGTVSTLENGTLILKTDYSEPIRIKTDRIRQIFTDQSVEVHLESGEVLKGKLKSEDGRVVVEPSMERAATAFQWNRVTAINPPTVPPVKWTGSVTAGGYTESGNSDRTGATLGFNAVRRAERDRYSLRFLYNYAEEDNQLSARDYYGAAKYDYFFTKKFFGYLSAEGLSDEFKDLNLRIVLGPGVGYQIWDIPEKSLSVEAGLSFFSEDLDQGVDDQWITGRLAANLFWKLYDSLVFNDYLVIYPSLENTGEYQLRNEAALSTPLASGWSLRLANILEHDSAPPVNVKKSDWLTTLGVQYGF